MGTLRYVIKDINWCRGGFKVQYNKQYYVNTESVHSYSFERIGSDPPLFILAKIANSTKLLKESKVEKLT